MENHILVGLGGTGGRVLRAFKKRMFEEYPDAAERSKYPIGLLYVDSTREMMGVGAPDFRVMGQDASFTEDETLYIGGDIENILENIEVYPQLKGFVDNSTPNAIGTVGCGAGQKRRAGRILFAANAVRYVEALNNRYARTNEVSRIDELVIHIFAGLAGGTGSGAIIDAIVQARKAFGRAKILVYAMIPEMRLPKAGIDMGRYYPNGYAALSELNSLQVGLFKPCDVTDAGAQADFFSILIKGVADNIMLYSNVNENGVTVNSFDELPQLVSDFAHFRVFMEPNEGTIDFIRAENFECMDEFNTFEYNENLSKKRRDRGEREILRTKKLSTFGIKLVIYPESRILKHITYSVGQRLLYQLQFNNWRDEVGYIGEAVAKDYRELYLNDRNKANWMLDDRHLTLERRILPTEPNYDSFYDFWHERAIGYAEEAKSADCPLQELDDIMKDFFARAFRRQGVESFYLEKCENVAEIARTICKNIERDLFTKWKDDSISLYDLLKISETVLSYVANRLNQIDEDITKNEEEFATLETERDQNLDTWKNMSILRRIVGHGNNIYAEHQEILTDLYVAKTKSYALNFARVLLSRLNVELGALSTDIGALYVRISRASDNVDRQITHSVQQGGGLRNLSSAVIEVGEEEKMTSFERELITNRTEQANLARELRNEIIPDEDFIPFGMLEHQITIDKISDAFDLHLAMIIKERHELLAANNKLFGVNILQQLQQELTTDEEIEQFARNIIDQSGLYLQFDPAEMYREVPNNESPFMNPASVNRKCLLISMPRPEGDEALQLFADKLEKAFRSSVNYILSINKRSPRKDELSIVSFVYSFPMRAIDCVSDYKRRYEALTNDPDEQSAKENKILLHSEGDGSQLANLFIVDQMKRDEYWPYMFVAAAMGILGKTDEGWGYESTDRFGRRKKTVVSEEFVDLLNSDEMTEELCETIYETVCERLEELNTSEAEKTSLEEAINALVDSEITPICSQKTAKTFEAIVNAAINLLK